MQMRKLGQLEVSPIGMGCMGFSHGYGKVPETDVAIKAIQEAHDYGCTFFDTAETYGREQFYPGHNEQLVGQAIKPFRKEVVLASKIHISTEEYQANHDLYRTIKRHLLHSLKNLQTDYLDLYYLHRYNEEIGMAPVAEVMGKLIDEGLIRAWGVSQVGLNLLKTAHEITPVSAVQNLYNMVERSCESEIIPYCLQEGIGFVPFSPIASGLLSGKITQTTKFEGDDVRKFVPQLQAENLAANQPIVDLLDRFSTSKHATKAQIALAWMLKKYPNVVPIPGSKNPQRIIENLGAWKVQLTDAEFKDLDDSLNQLKIYGHRGFEESQQHSFSNNWRS
ncbi:aldo/keto reductase [uncultured Limosilactobacillus sp.]|uniref:aldo/keto reductase n=1 Tax=uncultured Limosilactobacillus sp. TaxID=2837629 RepID=UPI0025F02B02|nr:aldo/keto reductase [uncultured Limosilactobacillus sp.]